MASKLCDSCKSATAALFCRPDSAFLCINCDCRIHAANNKLLPSRRHARVWLCEVCEQAPAHVTCKADAAALCFACDRDIHSANPLARRHDRVPVVPFYDAVPSSSAPLNFLDDRYFAAAADVDDVSSEEAEAASWLLPNPSAAAAAGGNNKESPDLNAGQFIFPEMDNPYLDLDYGPVDPKMEAQEQNSSGTDGVVPVQCDGGGGGVLHHQPPLMNDHCFDLDLSAAAFSYGYNAQLSSSSMEVGVVPDDGSAMADPYGRGGGGMSGGAESAAATPLSAVDREARVMRYREKRKNRKFEKTIRYASRKAYAETRPRIKGRFAKRTETEVEADRCMYGFGVVPSF